VKKSKIVKQSSDGNTEAISDPIQPASQTGQQSVVLGGNKMMRQNSNRDRNNPKGKSSKVRMMFVVDNLLKYKLAQLVQSRWS
jgi:hypothetical protein